jgi:hypothetical protein
VVTAPRARGFSPPLRRARPRGEWKWFNRCRRWFDK